MDGAIEEESEQSGCGQVHKIVTNRLKIHKFSYHHSVLQVWPSRSPRISLHGLHPTEDTRSLKLYLPSEPKPVCSWTQGACCLGAFHHSFSKETRPGPYVQLKRSSITLFPSRARLGICKQVATPRWRERLWQVQFRYRACKDKDSNKLRHVS